MRKIYQTLFNGLIILVSSCGFIFAFATAARLITFLSSIPSDIYDKEEKEGSEGSTLWALTINMALLCSFMFQHSVMAKPLLKKAIYSSTFQVIERSIYIIVTSFVLQCVMKYWQPIVWIKLWHFDTSGTLMWSAFTAVHCIAWAMIYVGVLMMDIAELLGVKQIYYNLRGLPDPLSLKSIELRRLYRHMRHPSFTAFCLLFWIFPVMSLDRLILAVLWTLYMMVAWNVDHFDYIYQSQQLKRKMFEMENSKITHIYYS
ncbi:hypothetical protein L9F63_008048 [Diploptera punctata]|uniref:Nuclear envelope membrane protein n=1 Tax=Diploptera punctata TaxID=6984 RepID=A0AAD8E2X7_DIPPU|nr:hypothetical protein L9F63_008048 [Diploptera punctata]